MPQAKFKKREYMREYMRRYRDANPAYRERHLRWVRTNEQRYAARRNAEILLFKANGCALCDENDPCCISAHHIDPEIKDFGISGSAQGISLKRLKAELAKCVAICENCHRKVHAGKISILPIAP